MDVGDVNLPNQTLKNLSFQMNVWLFPTISYVKIWFIIQLNSNNHLYMVGGLGDPKNYPVTACCREIWVGGTTSWVNQLLPPLSTFQKSNELIPKIAIFEGSRYLFQLSFGYPAVRFRGCMPSCFALWPCVFVYVG